MEEKDAKDPTLLLNSLNAGPSSAPCGMRNKRRLIPNFEVERQACGDVKKLKLKIPIPKAPTEIKEDVLIVATGEMIPLHEWVDTAIMVDEVLNFMKRYKVAQSKIARQLGVGQMWLSRMVCVPRQYDILQEAGRVQCRKLWKWLHLPEEERAAQILRDKTFEEEELDDHESVDTIEMVKQMQEEIETYNVSVSDYAKGSGVKYSWVYALLKTPNVYDSFNMSGKKQARILSRYLNLPLTERGEGWKFNKDNSKTSSLNIDEILIKVKEKLARLKLSAKLMCFQLHIDYLRFKELCLHPIPWENLNLPGRRMFTRLKEWISSNDPHPRMDLTEKEKALILSPPKRERFPPLDTTSLVRSVKQEMKLLKLNPIQLGDHLNIRNLQDLILNAGRWDKFDDSMKEEYHILKKWMESDPNKRIIEAQIIQGTFDPTTSYAQKLLAEQIKQEELEPMLAPEIKAEPEYDEEEEEEDCQATTSTTPTVRQAWQNQPQPNKLHVPQITKVGNLKLPPPGKPYTKRLVPVSPRAPRPRQEAMHPGDITITVNLPSTAELIKATTRLIEQRMVFSVGLDKISMTSPRDKVSQWLSFFSENGFLSVHVSC